MGRVFQLSTRVPSLKSLRGGDYSAYDALYLGDYSCPRSPGNLSSSIDELQEAVAIVKGWGKECYLSLYATPRDGDFGWIRMVLQASAEVPLDGVEVHDVGLLRLIREVRETLPVHLGLFSTVYVEDTVRALLGYGVERVFPSSELGLEEIAHLKDNMPADVVLPVHGKIPLAIWQRCFIAEYEGAEPTRCEEMGISDPRVVALLRKRYLEGLPKVWSADCVRDIHHLFEELARAGCTDILGFGSVPRGTFSEAFFR